MTQLMDVQAVAVDDASLATLEWLHEDIRNGYEPFTPKFYSAPGDELWEATQLCLRLARELVFESGSARGAGLNWRPGPRKVVSIRMARPKRAGNPTPPSRGAAGCQNVAPAGALR